MVEIVSFRHCGSDYLVHTNQQKNWPEEDNIISGVSGQRAQDISRST